MDELLNSSPNFLNSPFLCFFLFNSFSLIFLASSTSLFVSSSEHISQRGENSSLMKLLQMLCCPQNPSNVSKLLTNVSFSILSLFSKPSISSLTCSSSLQFSLEYDRLLLLFIFLIRTSSFCLFNMKSPTKVMLFCCSLSSITTVSFVEVKVSCSLVLFILIFVCSSEESKPNLSTASIVEINVSCESTSLSLISLHKSSIKRFSDSSKLVSVLSSRELLTKLDSLCVFSSNSLKLDAMMRSCNLFSNAFVPSIGEMNCRLFASSLVVPFFISTELLQKLSTVSNEETNSFSLLSAFALLHSSSITKKLFCSAASLS